MKRKRIFECFVVSILTLALFTGCDRSSEPPEVSKKDTGTIGTIVKKEVGAITFTDMANRPIRLEKLPERIVVLGSALRLYTYVAKTEKLVAVERAQQNLKSGRPYILANPELADLPIVGEGFPKDPDPELLLEAAPDVIIAGDLMDQSNLEELQNKIGIPIVITSCGSTAVFDPDSYTAIRIIGKLTDMESRSEDVVNYMKNRQQELSDLTKDVPESQKPTVYVGGLSYKGSHGIESTAVRSPLLTAIGARNVVDELGKRGSVMIDKEKLIEWDPDVIVIDENGLGIVKEDYAKNPDYYKTLSAVSDNKVFGQLPYVSYYNNIETAMIDIYYLGKLLYPKEFKDIDPAVIADDIYTFLLGEPLYTKMAEIYGGFMAVNLN